MRAATPATTRVTPGRRDAHADTTGEPAVMSTSTTVAGTTQYRWWTQEIGLIRQAVRPVTVTPASSSPRWCTRAARTIPTMAIRPAAPSHSTWLGAAGADTRASRPSSDWLLG